MPASLVLLLRKFSFILTLRVDQDSGSRSLRGGALHGYDTHLRQTMTDTAGNVTTYTYDVLNRLLRAETKDSGGMVIDDYQYTYDGSGNRLTQTVNGTTTSYTYNNANELTAAGSTTYSYDANGNLTGNSAGLSLSYNALNQTASITPPGGSAIGMSYAGDSQVERVAAGSRSFTNSALGLSLATDGNGTTPHGRAMSHSLARAAVERP